MKLTQLPISDRSARMGRPPLNVKPILVRLPDDVPDRIDALVGKQKRAEFIREAVERELKRREREQRAAAKPPE
ncbi:Arc/MetJ-type ribon-helix-helix transcriptional regulator [Pseudochelatococcus lubricantis]|uniref:Arc/MetJ-type ribon-helix-helix transcriptional regulator n=1 Tax=Pseudochelatococcus lubricantis TaxID=1538102 RepID=A0ABX0V2H2_9HYPH|nr:ribbon-helix-helix domain-containing protein [Pseudochelatococcus lubricantis]NIJ57261.1 Arc/MetJ-type ribon-helix-helix transcriptional regulator [Pseudochelatococcus lubricantis]